MKQQYTVYFYSILMIRVTMRFNSWGQDIDNGYYSLMHKNSLPNGFKFAFTFRNVHDIIISNFTGPSLSIFVCHID